MLSVEIELLRGEGEIAELVANLSYSWVWRDMNMSGAVEYFYNGWGITGGGYGVDDLLANPELAQVEIG